MFRVVERDLQARGCRVVPAIGSGRATHATNLLFWVDEMGAMKYSVLWFAYNIYVM